AGAVRIDAAGCLVAPGLVDLQCNGGHGLDLTTDPGSVWELGELLPRYGVTGFLPTMITARPDTYELALAVLADRPSGFRGAEPLGWHFEGPMLAESKKGAHPARWLRPPSLKLTEGWSRASGVALVTLAPELPGALEVVRALVARGVLVSAGHTTATTAQVQAALGAGVKMLTHLFNAMPALGHRDPGPVGVALAGDVTAGLIVDGIHVDRAVVRAAWRAMGSERIALVTDAVAALGLPPGRRPLGDRELVVGDDGVRLVDGTLAGSNLSLDQAVRNTVAFAGCAPSEALAAASATPARLLGDPDRGSLVEGRRADLVVLDADLQVRATVIGGAICFRA
ncbi:MAG TPA: N-acetylglucosamine-6-phosphate deacetylase, partial [Acidimicrobiales bacterium]